MRAAVLISAALLAACAAQAERDVAAPTRRAPRERSTVCASVENHTTGERSRDCLRFTIERVRR